jgi:hypothetical protein
MNRRLRRLARRSRAVKFLAALVRSYREGHRRGQSQLAALRFGRAVARWRRHNGAANR